MPLPAGFLAALRDITAAHGVIADLRRGDHRLPLVAAAARQARFGVTPDMCVLAKIVAGGLPGGAVAGRADIMDQLDAGRREGRRPREDRAPGHLQRQPAVRGRRRRHARHHRAGGRLRAGRAYGRRASATACATSWSRRGVAWGIYGEASTLPHLPEPESPASSTRRRFDPLKLGFDGLKGARNPDLAYRLRIAMLANGVDIMGAPGGLVSAMHGPHEVAQTLEAFRTSVRWMKEDGDI